MIKNIILGEMQRKYNPKEILKHNGIDLQKEINRKNDLMYKCYYCKKVMINKIYLNYNNKEICPYCKKELIKIV